MMRGCLAFAAVAAALSLGAGTDGVRMAEVAAFEQLADLAVRLPPQIRTSGIGAYSTNRLGFAMNNGLGMTAKGRLWASWIAGGDGPNSFTVASHSDDRVETWSDVALVIDGHGEVPTRGNFCGRTNIIGTFWLDPDGKFRLYTDQTLLHFDGRAGIWESVAVDPDAEVSSWGEPRRIGHGHLINKPIVLSNGDWAMAGYMTVTWTNSNYACVAGAFAELDAERGTTCYVSADRGATWEKRGTVRGLESDWNESQLVELKDGRLRVFMRATVGYGRMMVADSTDGGRTWTKPFSLPSMDNPNSRFQVTRLKGGRLLFVTHGAPAASCKDNQGRDRLTAYLSEDDGASWLGGLELWHGSASYPDCCQGPDGTIYVTHDHDRGGAAEIWLHRFTEGDVLAGRIVSREGKLNLLVSRGSMGSAAGIAAVKAVADEICTITACGTKTNGIAFVDYVLRPEAESDIRCRIELPPPEKWNGEFWGTGNSSFGGTMPGVSDLSVRFGAASATTDMGTGRYCDYGDLKDKPVPKAVLRDFYWRSTHLMTVYGKRMAKAFYGREPAHSFFRGGSRGGHQGMSEALRYPEDYDGVISSIPAGFLAPSSAQFVNLYGQTHDADGKPLVTREQLRIIADAPIEYMKDREPKPYAGKVLSNPFLDEKDVDGFLALAAKKDPALGDPDIMRRLKNVFMGVSRGGKVLCHGMTPGAFMGFERGRSYENRGSLLMELYYRQRGDNTLATWDEFEAEVRRANGYSSASSTDLRAFRARGGKLIVLCGWEDQTTPSPEMVAWYEMLAERFGGYGRTQEFCRLFPLPGHAHGGGKGRISTGHGYGLGHLNQLRRWVEEGVAPETYPHRWEEENLTFPIPPYPLMCYQDESGAWKTKRYPEGMVRRPDPSYYACDLKPEIK